MGRMAEVAERVSGIFGSMVREWLDEYVLDNVRRAAEAAGLPDEFLRHVRIEEAGPGRYDLVNDWKSGDGRPLAVFFNYGTKQHWVQPSDPSGVLAWEDPGKSRHARAIYYKRHDTKKGDMLFSKGHYVSGLPRTEAMEAGLRMGTEMLQERITREANAIAREFRAAGADVRVG